MSQVADNSGPKYVAELQTLLYVAGFCVVSFEKFVTEAIAGQTSVATAQMIMAGFFLIAGISTIHIAYDALQNSPNENWATPAGFGAMMVLLAIYRCFFPLL